MRFVVSCKTCKMPTHWCAKSAGQKSKYGIFPQLGRTETGQFANPERFWTHVTGNMRTFWTFWHIVHTVVSVREVRSKYRCSLPLLECQILRIILDGYRDSLGVTTYNYDRGRHWHLSCAISLNNTYTGVILASWVPWQVDSLGGSG